MLKINSLKLHNFGIIKGDRTFNFTNGVNLINGRNGSGKSTSLQAIKLLLLDDYDGAFEDYINSDCTEMGAEINFDFDNKSYKQILKCEKKSNVSTSRTLYFDGNEKPICNGVTDVKEYLSKLLNPTIVPYAISYNQNGNNKISKCKDAERRELLKLFMDCDYSNDVKTKLEPKIEEIEKIISELDKEEYTIEHTEVEKLEIKDLPFSEKEYNSFKTEYENIVNKLNEFKSVIEKNNIVNNQILDIKCSIDKLNEKITNFKNSKSEIEIKINNIPKEKESKLNELKLEYEKSLSEKKSMLENKSKSLNESLINSENKLEELKSKKFILKRVPIVNSSDESKVSEISGIEIRIKQLEKELIESKSRLEKINNGVCPYRGE